MKQLYPFMTFIFIIAMACIIASAVDSCQEREECQKNYSISICNAYFGRADSTKSR